MFRRISLPSSLFRFNVTPFWPRLNTTKYVLIPSFFGSMFRARSPVLGVSTLMTSAPISANIEAAKGPAMTRPKSNTFNPARAEPFLRSIESTSFSHIVIISTEYHVLRSGRFMVVAPYKCSAWNNVRISILPFEWLFFNSNGNMLVYL